MEYPWGNVLDEENETFNLETACDIASLRISAAQAQRNIESVYKEVFKCGSFGNINGLSSDFFHNDTESQNPFFQPDNNAQQEHIHFNDDLQLSKKPSIFFNSFSPREKAASSTNCYFEEYRNPFTKKSPVFHGCGNTINSCQVCQPEGAGSFAVCQYCHLKISKNHVNCHSGATEACAAYQHCEPRFTCQHCHQKKIETSMVYPHGSSGCKCTCTPSHCHNCHHHNNTKNQIHYTHHETSDACTFCEKCRRHFVPPVRPFDPPKYFKLPKQNAKPVECAGCSKDQDNYAFVTAVIDEHPHENSSKVTKFKKSVNKCPLKVTVPEPFQMTIRDENGKPLKDLKREQLRKQLNDKQEEELLTTIHHGPVPANTYLPIYTKMVESHMKRKQMRKENTLKQKDKSVKKVNVVFIDDSALDQKEGTHIPKARPIPRNILSSDVTDAMKNKEILRKIRIKQRAEETLKKSTLPFSSRIARSSSMVDLKKGSEAKNYNGVMEGNHGSSVSTPIHCSNQVMMEWNEQILKMNSHNEFLASQQPEETKTHEVRYKEFLLSQSKPLFDVPVRKTAASMMRDKEIRREYFEKKTKSNTIGPNKKITSHISSRVKVLSTICVDDTEEKLKNARELRKIRQKEYNEELEEINKRVWEQPLLIERQSEVRAKHPSKLAITKRSTQLSAEKVVVVEISSSDNDDENSDDTGEIDVYKINSSGDASLNGNNKSNGVDENDDRSNDVISIDNDEQDESSSATKSNGSVQSDDDDDE